MNWKEERHRRQEIRRAKKQREAFNNMLKEWERAMIKSMFGKYIRQYDELKSDKSSAN